MFMGCKQVAISKYMLTKRMQIDEFGGILTFDCRSNEPIFAAGITVKLY